MSGIGELNYTRAWSATVKNQRKTITAKDAVGPDAVDSRVDGAFQQKYAWLPFPEVSRIEEDGGGFGELAGRILRQRGRED